MIVLVCVPQCGLVICVCIHVCVYTCICWCVYLDIGVKIWMYEYILMCMGVDGMYLHMCCMYVCMYVYMDVIDTYIYPYI